jgi:L-ascorbate metabolism protein UlaG (beta-lactamase superfamily)
MPALRKLARFAAILTLSTGCARAAPAASAAPALATRESLRLTYLGVAGYQIESGSIRILADPYFSRPADTNDVVAPDPAAIAARAPQRADLILVGHSHFDHLLDVPSIALSTRAQVMGSVSTAHVSQASGVARDHIIAVKGGEDFAFEGFSVRVIPSLHSALDHKHGVGGEIPADVQLPMHASAYAEGGTLAYLLRLGGHEVLFLGTANFIERELSGLRPDVAIVATGLRHEIHDYTCRLMAALGQPPLVYTNHFDDWHAPPVDVEPSADLQAFVQEVRACSPNTKVVIPRHFVPNEVR